MATSAASRVGGPATLRADERALVAAAGAVFALASGGAAMAAAAADALFLADVGRERLGAALAISSALLAGVLAVVGGFADRLERRRVLGGLAVVSAAVLVALAALAALAPAAIAWTTYIGGKQLAAATDLAFWVAIAERVDARRSQRVLPMLAASGGAGAAIGAVLVVPVAAAAGARGVLVAGAALLVLAAIGSSRLGTGAARVAGAHRGLPGGVVRAWRDGARAVRRYPLAAHLAALVAIAGVFGALAYTALGFAVAAHGGDAREFATLFGGVRAAGQLLTLIVQLAIAPWLLVRAGTGRALLVAPVVAIASGLGLVAAPVLAMAIATQIAARVLDAGIETPAEKVALTLLPTAVRGRVGGFLDGPAKRAGAVLGGVLAAVLAGVPTAFYASAAVFGALWALAAVRIARELPALAIEHVAGERDGDTAVVDDRTIAALVRELGSERPERAAELLARLHGHGRVDAVAPLVAAATASGSPHAWRAVIAVLDTPAPIHGPALLDAARAASPRVVALAVRAVGLAGGVDRAALDPWRSGDIAVVAEVAALRLAGDRAELRAVLLDASRDAGPVGSAALEELAVELACALAGAPRDDERVLASIRGVVRGLRRGTGDAHARVAAFAVLGRAIRALRGAATGELALLRADILEYARERIDALASAPAPDHALVSLVRAGDAGPSDPAPQVAAALRVLGALLEGAATVEPDDLRRLARALGEPDDDVRVAAEAAFAALGSAAAGELLATVAYGRRRARDRAAALLADLPVTAATLDGLVDGELDALEQTAAALAVLAEPGDELVARRLDERLREIAYTVLLLVAARRRSPAVAKAAVAWRHARGPHERARTLAVIETALPRVLVRRLVEAVDELAPAERAAALARAGVAVPDRDAVIRAELAGRDRLARALVLHALGGAGRSAHRDAIALAARAEALAASPTELARRLAHAVTRVVPDPDEGATDMPTRVETLIALGKLPLLAALSTRQLADVAERARWVTAATGSVVAGAGDPIDALIFVAEGELADGDRRFGAGDVVDELACVAPVIAAADVVATKPSRLVRLERIDFEELVDDVPGLAAAVCRVLGERARRAADVTYRSPLASRG